MVIPAPRSLLAMALAAGLVAPGCRREAPAAATPAPTATPAPAAPVAGVDLAGRDLSTAPGDDFEQYANGGWRKDAVIPDDRSSTGAFLQVFEKAE